MAVASETLQYNCKADAVESAYCRLKELKDKFQEKAAAMVGDYDPPVLFYNQLFKVPKQEVITLPETPFSEEEVVETTSMLDQNENSNKTEIEQDNAKNKLLKAQLDLIEKVCEMREEALLINQQHEILKMEQYREREEMRMKKEHLYHLERLSGSDTGESMKEKVIKVKEEFERKMCAFKVHVGSERERLQALHAAAKDLERSIKEGWVQSSKSGNLEDDFDSVPLTDCGGFLIHEFNWNLTPPPPLPALVQEGNMAEGDENGDIAQGPLNDTSPPCQQKTAVTVEEVVPVEEAAENGDAGAAELTAQNGDGEISSEDGQRYMMMEQEAPSVAGLAAPTEPTTSAGSLPDLVEVEVRNEDAMADTPDTTQHLDPPTSPLRDATTTQPLPQQIPGSVPETTVPLTVPVQEVGSQSMGTNGSNAIYNGNGNENENLTVEAWQMLRMASPMVFPHGLHADPLRNELTRIKQQEDHLARRHEAKKMQLKMEMEEEMERIRRKYEEMTKEEERTYQRQKQPLEDVYKVLLLNQSWGEDFRAKFIEHRGLSASASAPSLFRNQPRSRTQLLLQQRVPQQIQRAPTPTATAAARTGSGTGSLCIPSKSLRPSPIVGPRIPTTSAFRPSTASPSHIRSQFSPVTLPPRSTPVLRTEHRAPAPHLARARPHPSAIPPSPTPTPPPASVAASPVQQLQSLLASQSQEGHTALSQTQTLNHSTDSLLASFISSSCRNAVATSGNTNGNACSDNVSNDTNNIIGANNGNVVNGHRTDGNGSGTRQVAADGDGVVCLSDDE